MSRFKDFSQQEFKQWLIEAKKIGHLKYFLEISESLSTDIKIEEFVYEFKTENPVGDIIIFSSIAKCNNIARAKGKDAVRIIYRWTLKDKTKYFHKCKLKRIDNFHSNFFAALKNTEQDIGWGGFGKLAREKWKENIQDVSLG